MSSRQARPSPSHANTHSKNKERPLTALAFLKSTFIFSKTSKCFSQRQNHVCFLIFFFSPCCCQFDIFLLAQINRLKELPVKSHWLNRSPNYLRKSPSCCLLFTAGALSRRDTLSSGSLTLSSFAPSLLVFCFANNLTSRSLQLISHV